MRETHVSLASVILCGGGLLITVKGIGDFYTSLKSRRGDVSLSSAGRLLPQAATMQASAGLGAISLCSHWIGLDQTEDIFLAPCPLQPWPRLKLPHALCTDFVLLILGEFKQDVTL